MEVEHVHNRDIRYTLSNENLQVGDEVYPIVRGRCRDDGSWVLHDFHWEDFMCGLSYDPHTIQRFTQEPGKQYREIQTDHGNSPEQCYYKIVKRERQELESDRPYARYIWKVIE